MSKIFINGYNSVVGGGKLIFDNLLLEISKNQDNHKYFLLVRNYKEYCHLESDNIVIVRLHNIFAKSYMFPILYFIIMRFFLIKYNIEYIFNLGDVIIPSSKKQVYFFDWAYAIDNSNYIWTKMPFPEKLLRLTKKLLIKFFIKNIYCVYCQTKYMRESLIDNFAIPYNNIVVFHTPIGHSFINKKLEISNSKNVIKRIFYPASFTIHKNFNYIIEIGRLIDKYEIPVEIILTIEQKESQIFWSEINKYNVSSVKTLGKLTVNDVAFELNNADALFFPSLLESYGLPIIEAMALKKPILVSDLPYSRTLCNNNAFYFDPFDPESGLLAIKKMLNNNQLVIEKINNAYNDFTQFPTWKDFYLSIIKKFN